MTTLEDFVSSLARRSGALPGLFAGIRPDAELFAEAGLILVHSRTGQRKGESADNSPDWRRQASNDLLTGAGRADLGSNLTERKPA